mmetsp:Transcript_14260/g.19999  ORF Transcript_14260/g.19999 Transcript_14260/m.19999 type:complete len:104 (-) Transcript_14260:267-578(-)
MYLLYLQSYEERFVQSTAFRRSAVWVVKTSAVRFGVLAALPRSLPGRLLIMRFNMLNVAPALAVYLILLTRLFDFERRFWGREERLLHNLFRISAACFLMRRM